jgi:hypothetical protein
VDADDARAPVPSAMPRADSMRASGIARSSARAFVPCVKTLTIVASANRKRRVQAEPAITGTPQSKLDVPATGQS